MLAQRKSRIKCVILLIKLIIIITYITWNKLINHIHWLIMRKMSIECPQHGIIVVYYSVIMLLLCYYVIMLVDE